MIRTILTIAILLALSIACNVGQATGYIHFGKATEQGYTLKDRMALEQLIASEQ